MNFDQLKKIQLKQAEIMDEIHRVCVENNLRYYLIGGSAIGAERHKGFIPWDLDIDIAMPRNDYELFIKRYSCNLAPQYKLFYHGNQTHYRSGHAIVSLLGSKIEIHNDNLNPQIKRFGLYIDILPLDKVPTNKLIKNVQKNVIKVLKWIKGMFLIINKEDDSALNKSLKKILLPIIKYAPTSSICAITHWVTQWGNKQKHFYEVCSMHSHYKYDRLCMPKEYFDIPALSEFEGRKYFVPSDIIGYLTKLFGDFRKLPPIEEQERLMNLIEKASW